MKKYITVSHWRNKKSIKKWVCHMFQKIPQTFVFVENEKNNRFVILTKKDIMPMARMMIIDGLIYDIWPAK